MMARSTRVPTAGALPDDGTPSKHRRRAFGDGAANGGPLTYCKRPGCARQFCDNVNCSEARAGFHQCACGKHNEEDEALLAALSPKRRAQAEAGGEKLTPTPTKKIELKNWMTTW